MRLRISRVSYRFVTRLSWVLRRKAVAFPKATQRGINCLERGFGRQLNNSSVILEGPSGGSTRRSRPSKTATAAVRKVPPLSASNCSMLVLFPDRSARATSALHPRAFSHLHLLLRRERNSRTARHSHTCISSRIKKVLRQLVESTTKSVHLMLSRGRSRKCRPRQGARVDRSVA